MLVSKKEVTSPPTAANLRLANCAPGLDHTTKTLAQRIAHALGSPLSCRKKVASMDQLCLPGPAEASLEVQSRRQGGRVMEE